MRDGVLVDSIGRELKKLRVSLTDACDFACTYCMPDNKFFSKNKDLLSSQEIKQIVSNLMYFGVDEVRLTGGEPLLRYDFLEVVKALSNLKLKKFALTTNAYKLGEVLDELKEQTTLHDLNISLDSLKADVFYKITKKDVFDVVLGNILKAKQMGFNVKINCVAMRNTNSDEIVDFVKFAIKYDIPVRFLETMKIGVMTHKFEECFISADEMIDIIKDTGYQMNAMNDARDSTSFNFIINHKDNESKKGQIGFIASESKPFCNGCSRLRLSSKGTLRPCLFKRDGASLRGVDIKEYPQILTELKKLKPMDRIEKTNSNMYKMGG